MHSPLLRTLIVEYPVLWSASVTVQVYCVDTLVATTTIVLEVSSEGDHLYSGLVALAVSHVRDTTVFSHSKLSASVTLDVMLTCMAPDNAIYM